MPRSTGSLRWHYMGGWATLLVAAVFLFAGLGLGVGAWFAWEREQTFAREGVAVMAKVASKTTRREQDRRSTRTVYVVNYQYLVNGQMHRGHSDVPQQYWQRLAVRGDLPVEYVRSDPDRSRVILDGGGFHWGSVTMIAVISAAFTLVGTAIVVLTWRKAGAKIDLILNGDVVPGTVIGVESRREGKAINQYLVYTFRDAAGQEVRGSEGPLSRRLRRRWSAEGQTIGVVIDRNDPGRHLPDVFEARVDEWGG